jgi:hypothetical protein
MNRSRYWAFLFALALLATALVWLGGQQRVSAGTVQPDRSSLALIPVQATSLFGLDLDALRATAVYAVWQQRNSVRTHDPGYDEFLARTGFDIERDLAAVLSAAWNNGAQPAFLAVATARYDPAAVSAFLKEKGAAVETYGGVELLAPDGRHTRPGQDYLALVLQLPDRPNTILAGTSSAVKQALDLRAYPAFSVLNNQALLGLAQKIGAENQAWAVSLAPGAILPQRLPQAPGPAAAVQANIMRILQGLQASTFAAGATNGLRLLAEGACASAEDAQTLADAARGLLAMLRLMAPANQPQVIELLNSFRIDQQQSKVTLTAIISPQLLQELAQKPDLLLPHSHSHAHPQTQSRPRR